MHCGRRAALSSASCRLGCALIAAAPADNVGTLGGLRNSGWVATASNFSGGNALNKEAGKMKKSTTRERPPARKLNREELETGVLAAGCGTQGCGPNTLQSARFINPDPTLRFNFSFSSIVNLISFR